MGSTTSSTQDSNQVISTAPTATTVGPFGSSLFWSKLIIQLLGAAIAILGVLALFGWVRPDTVTAVESIVGSPQVAAAITILAGVLAAVAPEVSAHLSHGIQNQSKGP